MKTRVILEILGEPKTGKTTLAEQFVHALSPAPMLLIDASPDQGLSRMMAYEPPNRTLAQALAELAYRPGQSREPIDWAFQELPVPAGDEVELLAVGALDDPLPGLQEEMLRYGLPRLMRDYEVVVVDGYHPAIHAVLPEELLMPLLVTMPQQAYRLPALPGLRASALIINRSRNGELPTVLSRALEERELRLVGKLPDYASPDERARRIGEDFHDCLLRMNLPVSLNP